MYECAMNNDYRANANTAIVKENSTPIECRKSILMTEGTLYRSEDNWLKNVGQRHRKCNTPKFWQRLALKIQDDDSWQCVVCKRWFRYISLIGPIGGWSDYGNNKPYGICSPDEV